MADITYLIAANIFSAIAALMLGGLIGYVVGFSHGYGTNPNKMKQRS